MTSAISVGIVGGGAAAVCILDGLEQSDLAPGSITVFEPTQQLWRGRPYQPDLPSVRVNIPPGGMSVRPSDDGHFQRWLEATGRAPDQHNPFYDPWCEATFVPRAVFGDYLAHAATVAIERLRSRGWHVEIVRDRVDHAAPVGNRVTLRTEGGQHVTVSYVVLCVGAGQPADSYQLAGTPGFVAEPYPLAEKLAGIEQGADVSVLGSGLTGVDTVLSLAAGGHRGRIRMLSRSGVLPAVRQKVLSHTMLHFTAKRFRAAARRGETVGLADLVSIMATEIEAAGGDRAVLAAEIASVEQEDSVGRLRRQVAQVADPDPGLRILQRAVPVAGPDVWPLLPVDEQVDVLRRRYRTVMSLCCPMPPTSARRLLDLIDTGQLEIVSGLRHIAGRAQGGFSVITADGEQATDVVVNAVNPPLHRTDAGTEPLITSLVQAGVTLRHPLGGLRVARASSGLASTEGVSSRIYALGALASGSLFFTFGMPSIVDRAEDIVQALVSNAAQDADAYADGQFCKANSTV
jgi:uncharacterized NAD(P)/FAD-binding protein YdhS